MTTLQLLGQPAKQLAKDVSAGTARSLKELQPSKALRETLVTESGSERLARALQPLKAMSSILVTELGMVRSASDMQP